MRYYVFVNKLVRNASQEGLCVLGAWYLICQDLVNCYFDFVL